MHTYLQINKHINTCLHTNISIYKQYLDRYINKHRKNYLKPDPNRSLKHTQTKP